MPSGGVEICLVKLNGIADQATLEAAKMPELRSQLERSGAVEALDWLLSHSGADVMLQRSVLRIMQVIAPHTKSA